MPNQSVNRAPAPFRFAPGGQAPVTSIVSMLIQSWVTRMPEKTRIFLAHASEDKELVRMIYSKLVSTGFQPWLDEVDLQPGQNWRTEIPKAIRKSEIFIACLSQRSVQKQGYVQKEFRLALDTYAEKPTDTVYLIPLKLEDCEIPDLQLPHLGVNLRDIHWLDFWKPGAFDRLITVIKGRTSSTAGSSFFNERNAPLIIFDGSHKQEQWCCGGAPPIVGEYAYRSVTDHLRDSYKVESIERQPWTRHVIENCRLLILVQPHHSFLQPEEISIVHRLVENGGSLMVLGYEFGDQHHESNLESLTKLFGIGFNYDRVVSTHEDLDNPFHPVIDISARDDELLLCGVRRLCFPLSCSLHVRERAQIVFSSGSETYTETPSIVSNGIVKRTKRTQNLDVPLIAKGFYGAGKFLVFGTWEFLHTKLLVRHDIDNDSFFENAIQWLISK